MLPQPRVTPRPWEAEERVSGRRRRRAWTGVSMSKPCTSTLSSSTFNLRPLVRCCAPLRTKSLCACDRYPYRYPYSCLCPCALCPLKSLFFKSPCPYSFFSLPLDARTATSLLLPLPCNVSTQLPPVCAVQAHAPDAVCLALMSYALLVPPALKPYALCLQPLSHMPSLLCLKQAHTTYA